MNTEGIMVHIVQNYHNQKKPIQERPEKPNLGFQESLASESRMKLATWRKSFLQHTQKLWLARVCHRLQKNPDSSWSCIKPSQFFRHFSKNSSMLYRRETLVHRENDVIILALKHKMRARVGVRGETKEQQTNTPDLLSELSCRDLQTMVLISCLYFDMEFVLSRKPKKKRRGNAKTILKLLGSALLAYHNWTVGDFTASNCRQTRDGERKQNGEAPPRSRVKPCKSEHYKKRRFADTKEEMRKWKGQFRSKCIRTYVHIRKMYMNQYKYVHNTCIQCKGKLEEWGNKSTVSIKY